MARDKMIEYDTAPPEIETDEERTVRRNPYMGCVDCFEVYDRMINSMYGSNKYGEYD